MNPRVPHEPIRTTVIGSYPFPGWLELAALHDAELGPDDREEAVRDAVTVAVADQVRAGLDVITDGEQSRYDFNLSFYAFLDGLELETEPRRRFGPRPTTSAAATRSSASSAPRAGSASSPSSSACGSWRRRVRC